MFDAGVDPLGEVLAAVRSLVAGFEADGLAAHEAAQIVDQCVEAERLLGALRLLAAATLEDKSLWRREGFRSVAAWMASKTGTAVGPAIATMEMVGLLADLPVVAGAFLAGRRRGPSVPAGALAPRDSQLGRSAQRGPDEFPGDSR